MSNRTLFEINHDFSHRLRDHPEAFIEDLADYLRSANSTAADKLRSYGITVFAMRHHSSPYKIIWGGVEIEG